MTEFGVAGVVRLFNARPEPLRVEREDAGHGFRDDDVDRFAGLPVVRDREGRRPCGGIRGKNRGKLRGQRIHNESVRDDTGFRVRDRGAVERSLQWERRSLDQPTARKSRTEHDENRPLCDGCGVRSGAGRRRRGIAGRVQSRVDHGLGETIERA